MLHSAALDDMAAAAPRDLEGGAGLCAVQLWLWLWLWLWLAEGQLNFFTWPRGRRHTGRAIPVSTRPFCHTTPLLAQQLRGRAGRLPQGRLYPARSPLSAMSV